MDHSLEARLDLLLHLGEIQSSHHSSASFTFRDEAEKERYETLTAEGMVMTSAVARITGQKYNTVQYQLTEDGWRLYQQKREENLR